MHYSKQDDFDKFNCIAEKCPASCCLCWQIVIDQESLDWYRNYSGPIKDRICHGIDFKEGAFRQNGRRCAMLEDSGLCSIQLNEGEERLCHTCKLYPRHIEEYEGVLEFTLSMSCPEVARMLVNKQEQMRFIELDDDETEEYDEFDYMLYTKLLDARERILNIIQNRDSSLYDRMRAVLCIASEMQKCLDDNRLFDMDQAISVDHLGEACELESGAIEILGEMEILNEDWKELLSAGVQCAERIDVETLLSDITTSNNIATEQVLTLLIYTYFCGAVYDDWIYSKAALCVYSAVWILYIHRGCEGKYSLEEVIYKYSREIEHSDLNLDKIEEYFAEK